MELKYIFSTVPSDYYMNFTFHFRSGSEEPSKNISNSTTSPCINDFCISDEDYINELRDYIFPVHYEWALIVLHCIVFIVGLTGNALVCTALYRNPSMRTVTNIMIMNLSVADFMVILVCLPPTVIWDVTETWFMGDVLCKIVLYVQTVSVVVSISTLTCIALDRWYAICYPLKFVSTMKRAKIAIVCIWMLALTYSIPDLVIMSTVQLRVKRPNTIYLTECNPTWSNESEKIHQFLRLVFLYLVPLVFMTFAYIQIFRVLWNSGDNITQPASDSHHRSVHEKSLSANTNSTVESQLRSRKKAAKMLILVVITFAICFLPVHLINTLRYLVSDMEQTDYLIAGSMVAHWLCYFNSAINPVIYNFMSLFPFRKIQKRVL
ncbi:orexin receptor type 2-like isoform X2 [Artemia franciscana]|uniref:orexin receptor type 2-like isoform X2 n=1 Tax=Artemia franciscana TaxID=6661 RepID=UPI0032DB4BA9